MIVFSATLLRPQGLGHGENWSFLVLPIEASRQLPSRSMVSVEGTFENATFQATLEPDGRGGHWLRVPEELTEVTGTRPGDRVALKIAPVVIEPEPEVPAELEHALAADQGRASDTWCSLTPRARRDWIHWITSAKRPETRAKRLAVALSKLAAGDRRPCCFDRSGMYSKSLSCPTPESD
ncbi:MAG TPA: YdeI/OmpD-associated family protein [Fimbriimonadaceae bacterium]|nr:YdeI/OmpD-associated family protein [Fimbriimonadaceae bacterium]